MSLHSSETSWGCMNKLLIHNYELLPVIPHILGMDVNETSLLNTSGYNPS